MANYKTGAQRRNDRMDKIFDRAKSEGRGLNGDSNTTGAGVHSPAMEEERKKIKAEKNKKTGMLSIKVKKSKAKEDGE